MISALRVILFVAPIAAPTPDEVYLGVGSPEAMREVFAEAVTLFDQGLRLQLDDPQQARRLFRAAAEKFRRIRASGVRNGRLEYNLGNCLLQAGDVGAAILHYRRAQRHIPLDPMLAENLRVARSRCLTHIRPTAKSTLLENAFFWHYRTSIAARWKTALLMYVAVWALLILYNFVRTRAVLVTAGVCALVALLAVGSALVTRWSDRHTPEGVVTSMDVVVLKGPGEGYQRLFEQPLQPGVEFVRRERTRNGWWKIELPDGKAGWIPERAADLIPEDTG